MKREYLWVLISICIILGVVMSGFGCAAPAPTKPIVLTIASSEPGVGPKNAVEKWWASEIEERTGGRIQIEYHWSQSLLKAGDTLEGVKSGLADMGIVIPPYHPGKTPTLTVMSMLFGASDDLAGLRAIEDTINAIPAMQDELPQWNQRRLYIHTSGTYYVWSTKPVKTMADFNGLRIRGWGSYVPRVWENAGGVATAMPGAEQYEALQRGVLDASPQGILTAYQYKIYEVAQYYNLFNIGVMLGPVTTINEDVWQSLPSDIQKIIMEVSEETPPRIVDANKNEADKVLAEMQAAGVEVIPVAPEDQEKLKAIGRDVWPLWAEEMEAKGLPGTEIIETFLANVAKYEK